jgi:hypothetical protein
MEAVAKFVRRGTAVWQIWPSNPGRQRKSPGLAAPAPYGTASPQHLSAGYVGWTSAVRANRRAVTRCDLRRPASPGATMISGDWAGATMPKRPRSWCATDAGRIDRYIASYVDARPLLTGRGRSSPSARRPMPRHPYAKWAVLRRSVEPALSGGKSRSRRTASLECTEDNKTYVRFARLAECHPGRCR